MEESVPYTETPSDSSSYGYTNPISSFFNGIFFIIMVVLVLIFLVILLFAQGVSFIARGGKPQETAPPAKEAFKDGPPYPSCKTNGSFAMF